MYINFMTDENKNIYISYWLLLLIFLVCLMIFIGGLTRLTDSGLSITKWNLFIGIFPPITLSEWENTFSLYKEIPEFKLLNSTMTLEEFKVIYWWEYIHRLLGRVIGIFYILPLLFFTYKKIENKKLIFSLYFIFLLICLQGFIGWYMVQSGLIDRTDVSHYRLSLHLTLAFIILILLVFNYLRVRYYFFSYKDKSLPYKLPMCFTILILLQISLGAFVSGLDAGQIYQTWPLMNNSYFPDDSVLIDLLSIGLFETPSIVQFIHRNLAYLIFFVFLLILILIFKNKNFQYLKKTALVVFFILLFQIFLGILTLLYGAQIFLASMHQMGSVLLVTTSLILVFKDSRIN